MCPFLGVSKKLDTAVGMALAVTFVMVIAHLRDVSDLHRCPRSVRLRLLTDNRFLFLELLHWFS
nr:Rnf-Nqr domain containing protein [uncultured Enterococcus sp.]